MCADLTAAAAGAEPSAVLRIEQLPDGRRVVHMAAGRVVEVPAEAPGALVQMLESASGARAVQAAARSLLRSQPLLMHPQAPCHDLLMQLASMELLQVLVRAAVIEIRSSRLKTRLCTNLTACS